MIRFASVFADRLARLALGLVLAAALASCGSGAVGPSTQVNDPTRITILPGTVTAFSSLPVTFTITGGTGAYIVASSNQSIVPSPGSIVGGTVTIIPNQVLVDTEVTLTVRDTGTATPQSATLTVKPGTVNNNITITPTVQDCAPALCSGGDATVSTVIAQGGIPLAARGVRFEVVAGDFLFVTFDPNTGFTTLTTSVIVVTDQAGKAIARIRATADAPNQTALLQITDLGSGAFQRTSFVIVQTTAASPGFFATPTSVTFQGRLENECATGGNATFYIFGGSPPYTISNTSPGTFQVSRDFVSFSGGNFQVILNGSGTCIAEPGAPVIIRDTTGRTVTVTVANIPGTQTPPAITVAPEEVTLTSCAGIASVTVAGGRSNRYFVSTGSDLIAASVSGNTVSISRNGAPSRDASVLTPPPSVIVGVSDGLTVANVKVNLTGAAAGICP